MPLRLFALALLLALSLPADARAWWNADWGARMRITAGAAGEGGADAGPPQQVGRIRVLVRLHQGLFNFGTAKEDGTDIRFVAADDKTPLRFHVERYDGLVDQQALFWVDLPELTVGGAGTSFYMYWGNKNAPPAGSARDVYDTETVLALNFGDDAGAPRDSTGYANNATSGAARADGLVAGGQRLDGTNAVRLPASATLGWPNGGPVTWSLWVRPDAGGLDGVLYQAREGAAQLTIGLAGGIPYAELTDANGATQRTPPGSVAIAPETWRQVAVVGTAERLAVFLDGVAAGEIAAALPAMGGAASIGAPLPPPAAPGAPPPDPAAAVTGGFVGIVDVVRIAKAARSPAFLQAALRTEGPRNDLLRFDVAEEGSVFGTGHFGIIARNLTIDAWIVIGICAVMAPFTWLVIGGKAMFIGAMSKANAWFRAAFREGLIRAGSRGFAGAELPDDARRRFRKSSLYRMYAVGVAELEARGGIHRAGHLKPAALASIRAAVDAQATRDSLRLSSQMVVLTIAIAGGPFIGLLGTVIGVMITFAAVAAAGDVNVNAIAPGIAAALAATVAGLFVAIPALFGYNYLVTRARDVNADMRTFADELVTRIGEGGEDESIAPIPFAKAAE